MQHRLPKHSYSYQQVCVQPRHLAVNMTLRYAHHLLTSVMLLSAGIRYRSMSPACRSPSSKPATLLLLPLIDGTDRWTDIHIDA